MNTSRQLTIQKVTNGYIVWHTDHAWAERKHFALDEPCHVFETFESLTKFLNERFVAEAA